MKLILLSAVLNYLWFTNGSFSSDVSGFFYLVVFTTLNPEQTKSKIHFGFCQIVDHSRYKISVIRVILKFCLLPDVI